MFFPWKAALITDHLTVVFFLLQEVLLSVAADQELLQKCDVPLGYSTDADMIRCGRHDTKCSSCIQALGCQWCSFLVQTKADGNQHCFPTSLNLTSLCQEGQAMNPCNSMRKMKDEPLSDVNTDKSSETGNADFVQLRPQHVHLQLKKGKPFNISLKYRRIKDYPVDLYFLMDLSRSMKRDKKNIAALGSKLAQTMRKMTSQFRLGFGSFVDKLALPFMSMATEKLKHPCLDCEPSYTYRNDLPLTEDDIIFTDMVKKVGVSQSLDPPEGGFDALMQAIVCPDIGWRNISRKIIVLSTDAKYNYAGIGKIAGILEPHDMKCHLDLNGSYTSGTLLDYPSVAQINAVAKEYQVNIIFAVKKVVQHVYKTLSKMVDYSSWALLNKDSSDVVERIKEQYEAAGCPENKEKMWIDVTTNLENVHIDIDVHCECDCEKPGAPGRMIHSKKCSKSGTYQCGVCDCLDQSYGKHCQCNTKNLDTDIVNEDRLCRRYENETQVCSGQGTCQCGQCSCIQPSKYNDITGVYCECNRGSCRDPETKIVCSGNGECDCDKCLCHQGWQSTFCECQTDEVCVAPGGVEACSGHGTCNCGKCTCIKKNGILYSGKYCEECRTCQTGRCLKYRDCVQCKLFGTGKLKGSACDTCTIIPEGIESLQGEVDKGAQLCSFVDESNNCEFKFTYLYMPASETYSIKAQSLMECPPDFNVLALVFGIIGAIVIVGLLTLIIWKIATSIQDRKEYAKFEEERKKAQWSQENNPLYKAPTSTFVNPNLRK
ncbi:integrin beta-PS-like isoform X2 [Oratosquilla oratoria]|uniref:integrin beta-PS-like isoform X2 n=1 Tax=Oratosquilla oratoria TaxID=337810 RepID=UPI003F75B0AE